MGTLSTYTSTEVTGVNPGALPKEQEKEITSTIMGLARTEMLVLRERNHLRGDNLFVMSSYSRPKERKQGPR